VAQKVLDPGAIHASRERRIRGRHHHDAFGIHLEDPMTDMIRRVFFTEVTLKSVTSTMWSEFSRASRVISESCEVVSATTSSNVERSSATSERRCAW